MGTSGPSAVLGRGPHREQPCAGMEGGSFVLGLEDGQLRSNPGGSCTQSHRGGRHDRNASPQGAAAGWTSPGGLPGTSNTPRHIRAQHPVRTPLLTHSSWTRLQDPPPEVIDRSSESLTPKPRPKKATFKLASSRPLSLPTPAMWLCSGFLHLPPTWASASHPPLPP